jgi:hypothetical protein
MGGSLEEFRLIFSIIKGHIERILPLL